MMGYCSSSKLALSRSGTETARERILILEISILARRHHRYSGNKTGASDPWQKHQSSFMNLMSPKKPVMRVACSNVNSRFDRTSPGKWSRTKEKTIGLESGPVKEAQRSSTRALVLTYDRSISLPKGIFDHRMSST